MSGNSASRTGTTLLVLLRDPTSPQAWAAFVDRYGPKIYGWCRRCNLQEADAQDVTQDVLLKLVRRMRTYDPGKGSFRAWLRAVTHHTWVDLLEGRKRSNPGGSDIQELIQTLEARDDLAKTIDEESQRELLDEAMARVQLRVSARDWKIFRALALDRRSAKEVAAENGMSIGAVTMVKKRVMQKLAEEVRKLEGFSLDTPEGES